MNEIQNPLASLPSEVDRMLDRPPVPAAEYRAHVMETQIFSALERWGFEERFRREMKLDHRQRKVFSSMKAKLRGVGAIVALVGERGLGKTTLAAQFAIETAWKNHEEAIKAEGPRAFRHVIYRKCAKIVTRYKPLFADFGSVETDSLLESLDFLCRQQEFLIIDELHDSLDLKMRARVLSDLIDRRYACCRDTILISNQTAADFSANIGDSIASRLSEHGAIIECKWDSYRDRQ